MANEKITSLGFAFNANEVAPSAAMEAVPAGWYAVMITGGEVKPTAQEGGLRLALEWAVSEGQYKGRKIFDGLNIRNANAQAQEIAARDLSAICHATGVLQVTDVSQLFGRIHEIKVDVEPARTVDTDNGPKTYEAKNRFKGARASSGTLPTVATGAPGATPPAWAAKPAAPPPFAAAVTPPAAQTAPVTPPAATAEPAKRRPGRPPKAAAAPAPVTPPPAPERMIFVGIDSPEFEAAPLPESKVAAMLAQGMPAETPLCLEGSDTWQTAAELGIAIATAPAPTPAAQPAQPAPATPPAGYRPPWAR